MESALSKQWKGNRSLHLEIESSLEQNGLKAVGERRDQQGGGGRTELTLLRELGLVVGRKNDGALFTTLAGEDLINGMSPTEILTYQVIHFQYPSCFSAGVYSHKSEVDSKFHVHPFWFMCRLLSDDRIKGYLTREEVAFIIIENAVSDSEKCVESVIKSILESRERGTLEYIFTDEFVKRYKGNPKGTPEEKEKNKFKNLLDIANNVFCWMDITQYFYRAPKRICVLPDRMPYVRKIAEQRLPFIGGFLDEEKYQRAYGRGPYHARDDRDLTGRAKPVTGDMVKASKVKLIYHSIVQSRYVACVDKSIVDEIAARAECKPEFVENVLSRMNTGGSGSEFLTNYYAMAFAGREQYIDFEIATTNIFNDVFGYRATHLGQMGTLSAPDVLLISDSEGYQSIIDTKAYKRYTLPGKDYDRMVYHYVPEYKSYSTDKDKKLAFFAYIAGAFGDTIDSKIKNESDACDCSGSCINASNFIHMVENQTSGKKKYTHKELRDIFGVKRQITLADID